MSCLDVLIDVPVQGGQEKYGGKNMDAIQKLLDFMEKRIDKVTSAVIAGIVLLFMGAAHAVIQVSESLARRFSVHQLCKR